MSCGFNFSSNQANTMEYIDAKYEREIEWSRKGDSLIGNVEFRNQEDFTVFSQKIAVLNTENIIIKFKIKSDEQLFSKVSLSIFPLPKK
jgi:hypothetical protein